MILGRKRIVCKGHPLNTFANVTNNLRFSLGFILLGNKFNIMRTQRVLLHSQTDPFEGVEQNDSSNYPKKMHSHRQLYIKDDSVTKEIVYQNRIFNVKKKFTMALGPVDIKEVKQRIKTTMNESAMKFKPSEGFSKYIDSIQKNRVLLRRGVCELPIEPIQADKGRNRYRNDEEQSNQLKKERVKTMPSCELPSKIKRKRIGRQSWQKDQSNSTKDRQLPILQVKNRSENDCEPKSQRFNLLSQSNKQLSQKQQSIKIRNAIRRKLDIEIINYELLGRWGTTSVKL